MSTYDDPFESSRRLNSPGCVCGRHRSEAEHAFEARRMLQCVPADGAAQTPETRYRGVIATAAIRTLSARTPRSR